ncbi:hypothetical protein TcCL_NonESM11199, partial [Trypanosoma cruzi]
MSAPPEKTRKLHTTPLTCFPNIIPTHRDTPNRSIRHSMHLPTQSNSPCTTHGSSSHPSNKCSSDQCYPRAAVGSKQKRRAAKPQKSATTGRKSTERSHSKQFSPNALNLPPSPHKSPSRRQSSAPSNKVAVQHQEEPQCLLLPSGSVVDAMMSRNAHWCFETTLHTCDASYGLRRTCLTSTTDARAQSVRPTSSRKQRIRQGGSKALAGNSRRRHHHKQLQQRCRPWGDVDQLTHGVCGKEGRGGFTRIRVAD